MAKQVHDATGPNQHIAPGVTDQVPPQPGMWSGPVVTGGPPPPEGWTIQSVPGVEPQMEPQAGDIIAPVSGNVERLGAAYRIKANVQYAEPANWQPTRASEFYGWSTGR